MRLKALTAGIGVPGPSFDGTVHSVFARAINISVERRGLIALVAAELGNFPRAFAIDAPEGFDFTRALAVGQAAACRGGVLRFAGSALSVDLAGATPWRAGLQALDLDVSQSDVARAVTTVSRLLADHAHGADFARLAADRIAALVRATERLDGAGAGSAAARLVGLGAGLTPAGDDYLVGYLASLWSVASPDVERHAFRTAFAAGVARAAQTTNEISRTFLEAAAEGEISERLASLVAAIARASPDAEIVSAGDAALAIGASSGADGVAGLLGGLDAFDRARSLTRRQATSSC